jgi:hypothetical protein
MGFHLQDELILRLLCQILQLKLDSIVCMKEVTRIEKEITNTIQLTSQIAAQKNLRYLNLKLKENLPAFFGFESVGLLLRDLNRNDIFSINETTESVKHISLLDKQYMDSVKISYPKNLGISGIVLKQKQLYVCDNAKRDPKF